MILIVSVVLTALVLTIALGTAMQSQVASANLRMDQANTAAESAGQVAVWQFKHNNGWRQASAPATLPTLVIGPYTYTYALTCMDAGAVATLYWPFNEGTGTTTADTSGHGNTGQIIGGVTWVTGKYGDALQFDGSTGYVDAGNNSSTNITGSVTMAAWVKMASAGNDQKVGGNQSGVAGGYKTSIYGMKVEFEVRDASNGAHLNRSIAGGTLLTMGTWYHACGVYNASTNSIKTYVDGVLDREIDNLPVNALGSTTGDFIMGREPWTTGSVRFFDGDIDDVRVYNRALTDTEIKTLANTSVHVHTISTLQNTVSEGGQSGTYDFISSAPTPIAPLAPALTVGGNLPMNLGTVSGNVQVTGNVTAKAASTVNGTFTYSGTYTDPNSYITVMYQGKASAATKLAGNACPTINYSSIQSAAVWTGTAGTAKTYQFLPLYSGQVPIMYVNGNVTDPVIDSSQSGGTLLINGTLTFTKSNTIGSSGFPVYVITEGNVSHSGGTITLTGGLYIKGTWTHADSAITGDVVVTGNVTDNTVTASTYIVGGIPWFDPRGSATPTAMPLFYTDYEGAGP